MKPSPLGPALALALLVAAVTPGVARADEAEAANRFKEGAAAYAKRDFLTAAKAFEAANLADPNGATLYNAGLSWEAAGEAPKAAEDYDKALSSGALSATQGKDAKRRLGLLAPKLGLYRVDAPPGAKLSIDGGEPSGASAQRYVTPGDHALEVTFADGRKVTKHVAATAGATATAAFEEPPPEPPPPPPPPPPPAFPVRTVGFVVLGSGALAGIIAVGLGAGALAARSAFESTGDTSASDHDRAASLRTGCNVTLVLTGVLAASGLVMVLLPARAQAPSASLRVGPGAVGLAVRF